MIWSLYFFMFLLASNKDFLFMNYAFALEDTSNFMTSVSPLVYLVISSMYFNTLTLQEKKYYLVMFMAIITFVSLCFITENSLFFLLMLETTVFFMTFLILNFSKDQDKMNSMYLMFTLNILGSILFMMFSSKIMKSYSLDSFTLNFLSLGQLNSILIWVFFSTILLSKLPIMFFHFWLTKAHVSASGSSSMLLASLMLKLGSMGLFKFAIIFLMCASTFLSLALSLSLVSSLIFCLVMLRFFDLKYMVACSSILHMSMILPLSMMMNSSSLISSLMMMVGHGLISYYLFFLITLIYESSFNRSMDFNKSLESVNKNFTAYMSIFMFLNLGVPPLINFLSEMIMCYSLSMISNFSILMFATSMTLTVIFTMHTISKKSFGKKNLFKSVEISESLNLFSPIALILSTILILLFN